VIGRESEREGRLCIENYIVVVVVVVVPLRIHTF
jgi:hypothetical protein